MRRDAVEPLRDPRYPSRAGDPAWRRWHRRRTAPAPPPPGRRSIDGRPGPSPRTSVRLPGELLARAASLARWRRTSVAAVVRTALEHHLDEGVGGRAGRPRPGPPALVAQPVDEPPPDLDQAYAQADAGTVAEDQ